MSNSIKTSDTSGNSVVEEKYAKALGLFKDYFFDNKLKQKGFKNWHEALQSYWSTGQDEKLSFGATLREMRNNREGQNFVYLESIKDQMSKSYPFSVHLDNCGNIDFGQNPFEPLFGTMSGYYKLAKTLSDCSKIARKYIEQENLGGGNWNGGSIIDKSGKQLGRVAYNGRIFDNDDKEIVVSKKKISNHCDLGY